MNFSKNNWSKFLYLKDQKLIIFLVLLSLGVSSYLGFMTPFLMNNLYQSYSTGGVDIAIRDLVTLVLAEYFVSMVYQFSINKYVQELLFSIRSQTYQNWLTSIEGTGEVDVKAQKDYPMGEVLARILTDTEAVIEMVSTGSFKIFIDFIFIISCLVGFVKLNTILGPTLIVAEVFACVLLVVGSKKMAIVYMQVRKSTGVLSRVIANLSGGFPYTFHHPQHRFASKKGIASFEDFLRKQLKANVWDASYYSLAESLFPILLALVVVVFPYSQIVEIAVLAAIIDLIQRSISPIKEVAGKISSIQRARTGIMRIEEFNASLNLVPKSSQKKIKREEAQMESFRLDLEHFSYPKEEKSLQAKFALKDICIEANTGELIGIVGQSGCGKSTLLKILSTSIMANKMKVRMNFVDGKEDSFLGANMEDVLRYKSYVGLVSQDSHVFSSSLRFNISMSDDGREQFDAFWNDVIAKIPYISEWGVTPETNIVPKSLSLGQRQLISALRSCYLSKPIVLFDEISSGLDSELEEALRKLVLIIQKKSLTFIVAHRIETIVNAQQILVMENGKIVGRGTHKELLEGSLIYQDFISQLNNTF